MNVHFLKVWPEYFEAIIDGRKPFEVRKNDRDFQVGDVLELAEFDPGLDGGYTGRETERRVDFILHGGQFGVEEGYVVMTIQRAP